MQERHPLVRMESALATEICLHISQTLTLSLCATMFFIGRPFKIKQDATSINLPRNYRNFLTKCYKCLTKFSQRKAKIVRQKIGRIILTVTNQGCFLRRGETLIAISQKNFAALLFRAPEFIAYCIQMKNPETMHHQYLGNQDIAFDVINGKSLDINSLLVGLYTSVFCSKIRQTMDEENTHHLVISSLEEIFKILNATSVMDILQMLEKCQNFDGLPTVNRILLAKTNPLLLEHTIQNILGKCTTLEDLITKEYLPPKLPADYERTVAQFAHPEGKIKEYFIGKIWNEKIAESYWATLSYNVNKWFYYGNIGQAKLLDFRLGYLIATGKMEVLRTMCNLSTPFPKFILHKDLTKAIVPLKQHRKGLITNIYLLSPRICKICVELDGIVLCSTGGFPSGNLLNDIQGYIRTSEPPDNFKSKAVMVKRIVENSLTLTNLCVDQIKQCLSEPEIRYLKSGEEKSLFHKLQGELPQNLIDEYFMDIPSTLVTTPCLRDYLMNIYK